MKLGRGRDRLAPDVRRIVDRLERGEIGAEEAGRLLIASAEAPAPSDQDDDVDAHPDETPEEAAARELVERIARETYDDPVS